MEAAHCAREKERSAGAEASADAGGDRNETEIARAGGRGNGELRHEVDGGSVSQDEGVLGTDGGDGCTVTGRSAPRSCALKHGPDGTFSVIRIGLQRKEKLKCQQKEVASVSSPSARVQRYGTWVLPTAHTLTGDAFGSSGRSGDMSEAT